MAIQTVNVGTTPNDGTGDPARTAFIKLNNNFTQSENAASKLVATNAQAIAGTAGVLTDAAGVHAAIRGLAVGTVSQSGGVPTGAIIESGSNANGEYVRFADGTQICTSPLLTGGNVDIAYGPIASTGEITWTFPAPFITMPNTSGVEKANVGGCWVVRGQSGAESNTTACYRICRAVAIAAAPAAGFIAIGRWY